MRKREGSLSSHCRPFVVRGQALWPSYQAPDVMVDHGSVCQQGAPCRSLCPLS